MHEEVCYSNGHLDNVIKIDVLASNDATKLFRKNVLRPVNYPKSLRIGASVELYSLNGA